MPDLEFASVEQTPTIVNVVMLWVVRLVVTLAFGFIGATKLSTDPHGMWVKLFDDIGLGQWFRYFTGVMQLGGAVLMLTPRTLTLGAGMLACTMAGAAVVDVFVEHQPGFAFFPLTLLGIVASVWYACRFSAASRA